MSWPEEWNLPSIADAFAFDFDGKPIVSSVPAGYKPAGGIAEAFEAADRVAKQAKLEAAAEAAAIAAIRSAIAPCEINVEDVALNEGEGFLYILQFSTGAIKVGQTAQLRQRLAAHRRDAIALNVTITGYWVSPAHTEYLANEKHLIAYCAGIARRAKAEYFHGTDLATVREFAAALPTSRFGEV